MFIGHFGAALGAKALAPRTSLGSLFLAAQFIDLLWPTLLLLGLEEVRIAPGITRVTPLEFVNYPISHSLVAVLGWGALFGVVYQIRRNDPRGAIVLGLLVVSHWVLDFVVHRPDLPLYPGGAQHFGLGLWSSVGGTLVVELAILGLGLWLYLGTTAACDAVGRWALWGLVVFLVAVYVANIFGDPPPNVTALAWVGQAQWLLVAWGYWVERHRPLVPAVPAHRPAGST